ncbi:unnamed protein product, partial [Choristocarpus tenellus]
MMLVHVVGGSNSTQSPLKRDECPLEVQGSFPGVVTSIPARAAKKMRRRGLEDGAGESPGVEVGMEVSGRSGAEDVVNEGENLNCGETGEGHEENGPDGGLDRGYVGKRKDYLTWDDYFMSVAFLSAMRSKDPSTQVGACIVNREKRIVGIGYNGFPMGCSDDELPWARSADNELDTKYPVSVLSFERCMSWLRLSLLL